MRLERTEVDRLGRQRGRQYEIDSNDEIVVIEKDTMDMCDIEKENYYCDVIDSFQEGWNKLEEIDGQMYEAHDTYFVKLIRKAYLK